MARPKVVLDSGGVLGLLKDPGVATFLVEVAEKVAEVARETAPIKAGNYVESIGVVVVDTDRKVARMVATAPHAHLVEARTGNLAKALGSAGGGL